MTEQALTAVPVPGRRAAMQHIGGSSGPDIAGAGLMATCGLNRAAIQYRFALLSCQCMAIA
jgi:hypothetical protein